MLALPLIPLLALGLAVVAGATDKEEAAHGPTVIVPLGDEGGRAVGDDCSNPIIIDALPYYGTGLTTCGALNDYTETCLSSYDGGEDVIFQLDLAEETTIDITMDPLGTGWTGIAIDGVCPLGTPCIASNTGSSGVRTITGLNLAAGTYYIMVDTWPSPDCIPSFDLTIVIGTPPPPPPENDTCDGAIAIERCTSGVIEGDLTYALNDYDPAIPGPSCTGYAATGNDVTYVMDLLAGDEVSLFYFGGYDESIYIVTDCGDLTTCVVGEDGTVGTGEEIFWIAPADGTYYIIADKYGVGGGPFDLTYDIVCPVQPVYGACCFLNTGACQVLTQEECEALPDTEYYGDDVPCDPNPCPPPVPTLESSWGQIKSSYR
jgi:hypothetical protein